MILVLHHPPLHSSMLTIIGLSHITTPPASRPLFDEKIYRFSGWHHHFIWQVVLSFLEFKEKRPSPFWENGVFRFCLLRPHLALNRPLVFPSCLGPPRWLVIGRKWIKFSWAHGKWPMWHYLNPGGLSFGPSKGPYGPVRAQNALIWL